MAEYIEESWRIPAQKMEVGDRITTKARTITRTDVEMVALLGGDYAAQFLSREAAEAAGWKDQLLPGVGTLNIAYGLLIQAGFLADVVAYMGTDRLRFFQPVYPGDAIRMEAEVAGKKLTEKGWICEYDWKVRNQHDEVVASGRNI
jgi:acyl dehydratase